MIRFNLALAAAAALAATPALASTEAAPAAHDHADHAAPAASAFSVETTDIGTLLDNPATKAILIKHIPEMAGNPQIEMARPMTLKQVQGFAPDAFSDELLGKIDADLKAIK